MATISILLPTHARNASGMLAAAIDSVLAQSHGDFELIIVDDGSTDGSADTIAGFMARDSRVRSIRFEQNIGLPALTTARAFCDARGSLIAWMFDDCVWTPDCLAALKATLYDAPGALLSYGQCALKTPGSEVILGAPLDRARLAAGDNHIPNCATLVRKEAYERLGWPDPHVLMVRHSDWDFWNRAAQAGEFAFTPQVLAAEHGIGLVDSLGNSVTALSDFVLRLAQRDRASALHPSLWRSWRPLAAPANFLETDAEREAYLAICLEHLARVGRPDDVAALAQDAELASLQAVTRDAGRAFAWWGARTRQALARANADAARLQMDVLAKQQFIDQQQAFIDRQQAYIDQDLARGQPASKSD